MGTKEQYCGRGNTEKDDQAKKLCSTPQCPRPLCAQPERGCKYVQSNEKNDDGCPKHPCGKLVCENTEQKVCCKAMTLECLSCQKDMTKEQYCGGGNTEKDDQAKKLCSTPQCPRPLCAQSER